MDWSRVPVFLKVVDQGSFTAAAKSLGVPKSTASRAVTSLETELGTQLLQRTTRALELTEAGRAFYERARSAREALEEAQAFVHHNADEASGVVRLSLPNDAWAMAELLAGFSRRYPKIQVEMFVTNRRVNLVEEGIDLALRGGKLDDSSLIARKLRSTDFGLFATREYVKKHGAPKTVDELQDHPFVLFRGRQGRQRVRLTSRHGDRELTVHGALSSDDLGLVRALAAQGVGVCLFPLFVNDELFRVRFERLLPDWVMPGGGAYLVMPASKFVPTRVRLLADYLFENFKQTKCA